MEINKDNYYGVVARCQHDKLGVITDCLIPRNMTGKPVRYVGIGFDGKKWESILPVYVADNLDHYVERLM